MPGCVVLALRNDSVLFEKAYGNFTYNSNNPVPLHAVYDMASVTKICATTISIMKLYEEGKLDLDEKLSYYLPALKKTNKKKIKVKDVLLHQAGMVAFIPFYKETLYENGWVKDSLYAKTPSDSFAYAVADSMYMRTSWYDTIYQRIYASPMGEKKYIYSDNDFIFLADVVKSITGKNVQQYADENFYKPMQLKSIGFLPMERNNKTYIAPTEAEKLFRNQLIHGYVHDPGAAMMGGIAGHAGLFSNAYDIAAIMQMLVNEGNYNGNTYLKKETIAYFTSYQSKISRRGLGFDKPEKDNAKRSEPYPNPSVSSLAFGHTGFTGTCAWADPATKLVFVFLSNRVHPVSSSMLLKLGIRGKIMEQFYK
jgi:beta-N-acetylhexosaminidase